MSLPEMRYRLEKYNGPKTRYTCPSCGKKGEFTRYIDENGRYFGDDVGRCNRVIKCGYHKKPDGIYYKSQAHEVDFSDIALSRISIDIYNKYPTDDGIVIMPLFRRYGITLEDLRLFGVTRDIYYYDGVVYWEKISENIIQGAARIRYNPETFKRIKDVGTKYLNRVYNSEYKRRYPFGYNAIDMGRSGICVVESQKTAVIMNKVVDKYSWVASCGSGISTVMQTMRAIFDDTDIILVPDVGCEAQWARVAKEYKAGLYRIKGRKNDDILDYYMAGNKIKL